MKKITVLLLILVLASQMSAAAFADDLPDGTRFSEMEYMRPDLNILTTAAENVITAIENGEAAESIEEQLEKFIYENRYFKSMYTLASIRYFQNMSDEFYFQEYAVCGEMSGTAEMVTELVYITCAKSEYAETLEKDFFWDGFSDEYGAGYDARYSDAAVGLKNRESELVAEFYALLSKPVININGTEMELSAVFELADDDTASAALLEYYRQYNRRYADVFIELVKVRTELAKEMGYADVWDMQCDAFAREFSGTEANALLSETAQKIVPIYRQLMEEGRVIEGFLIDEPLLVELMDVVTAGIGGYTDEAYRYMKEYELYDISQSENKAPMSFTSYIDIYESPFSFVTCNSTEEDILSLSHEFGHYAQMYASFNGSDSLELSECCSQAMELLTVSRAGEALDEESVRLLREYKMSDILTTYVQEGMFARFEDLVYSADPDQLSVELLNSLCLQSAYEFGMADYYGEEYCSMLWSDLEHIYEYQFYLISYLVSADAAMQIYEAELEAPGAGAEIFDAMLPYENMQLEEAIECAGLVSPFENGRIAKTADTLREVLINDADKEAA